MTRLTKKEQRAADKGMEQLKQLAAANGFRGDVNSTIPWLIERGLVVGAKGSVLLTTRMFEVMPTVLH